MIAPDHPAVEAAMLEMTKAAGPLTRTVFRHHALRDAADALNAALPDLDAATPENLARLRDTPVGRALMAEAWKAGEAAGSAARPDPLEDPMNQTTTVYGMPVELPEPPPGMIVADVVILARAVPVDGDRGRDHLLTGITDDTGGMVYRGILAAAADVVDVRDGDSDD